MGDVVSYSREGEIAYITVDSPPVNALSLPVRAGLQSCVRQFVADSAAKAAILICAGRTFIAGADITEFDKPRQDPWLPEVIEEMFSHAVGAHRPPFVVIAFEPDLGQVLKTSVGRNIFR